MSLKAGEIALAVLKKNPEHPGANHYALHAFDDGEHAARALAAAKTYARIAPASSHARHMPSHVFLPLGMWDEAVASDEAAFATSVEIAKRKGSAAVAVRLPRAVVAALRVSAARAFREGRERRCARSSAPSPVPGPVRPVPPVLRRISHESEIGKGYGDTSLKSELASMKARLVVESGDWSPMKGQGSFDNIDELFALGMASVPLGDRGRADAALEQLTNAAKTIPDQDAREVAAIMAAEIDGLIKLGRNDRAGALAALARAAALEAKRPRPVARPYPIKPAGELYAEILLGTGDAKAAVVQFKTALARTPGRAQSLLGLARAASVAGPKAESVKAAKDFLAGVAPRGQRPTRARRDARAGTITHERHETTKKEPQRSHEIAANVLFRDLLSVTSWFDQISSMSISRT